MAKQLAPLLKPPPPGRGSGMSSDGPDAGQRDALNMPVLPVTGFFRRLGALAFDLLLLYTLQRFATFVLNEAFLSNPDGAWFLAGLLAFLYFALGYGPIGKGQTVGKWLVAIRVTTLDGDVPSLPAAALRTVVLMPFFLTAWIVNAALFREPTFANTQFSLITTIVLMISLIVANLFAIVFNPFKMGMHDYVAKTLVRPAALQPESFADLRARIGPGWRKHYLQPQLMGLGTFLIVFVFLVFNQWPSHLDAEKRRKFDYERALISEVGFPPRTVFQMSSFLPLEEDGGETTEGYQAFIRRVEGTDPPGRLKYKLRLGHKGRWPLGPAEAEALSQRFAKEYHQRIFGAFEGPDLGYNWDRISTEALRRSTFTMRVEIYEYYDLFYPGIERPLSVHEFTFPPLEQVALPAQIDLTTADELVVNPGTPREKRLRGQQLGDFMATFEVEDRDFVPTVDSDPGTIRIGGNLHPIRFADEKVASRPGILTIMGPDDTAAFRFRQKEEAELRLWSITPE
jgi:uncharacterized RDD family membrane protein YckC